MGHRLIMSFGIFAPGDPLVLAGLFVSAAAVCGAILLILEMYDPLGGLIRISDAPLRAAIEQLGRWSRTGVDPPLTAKVQSGL